MWINMASLSEQIECQDIFFSCDARHTQRCGVPPPTSELKMHGEDWQAQKRWHSELHQLHLQELAQCDHMCTGRWCHRVSSGANDHPDDMVPWDVFHPPVHSVLGNGIGGQILQQFLRHGRQFCTWKSPGHDHAQWLSNLRTELHQSFAAYCVCDKHTKCAVPSKVDFVSPRKALAR